MPADPLGVAHFAEHPAVRAGDPFDRPIGTVGIDFDRHRRIACRVDILGGNLTLRRHPLQMFTAGDQATFAVRNRDRVDVARLDQAEPGRQAGYHPGIGHPRNVATYPVKGEGRAVLRQRTNLSVRQQTQFDQRLESVADAEHQPVPFIEQLHDCFGQTRAMEQGRNELAGAVRFVAGAEPARQHQYLAATDRFGQCVHRLLDVSGRQVAHHQHFRLAAGLGKGAGRIILAVAAGEYRDDDPRFRHGRLGPSNRRRTGIRLENSCLRRLPGLGGKHFFQRFIPCLLRRRQGNRRPQDGDFRLCLGLAQ